MGDKRKMTEEELKQTCTERAKIFQQAMESCKSSNPMDCIEWFADRIAELEAENQKWKDEWQEQVQKATDEGYARTLQTIQLTKAKEIINDLVHLGEFNEHTDEEYLNSQVHEALKNAEQFLKE